jgi:ATP-dependent DNA helicase RecG
MMLANDIASGLAQGMGLELHWFPEDVGSARLAQVMVGMANGRGGSILLGIAPRTADVHGIRHPQAALDLSFQAALLSDPPLILPLPRFAAVASHQVLVITIPPGLPNVYSLDGRYWGRQGSQTTPLSARQLRQLLVERGMIQFESHLPPQATLDDLDMHLVEAYLDGLSLPVGMDLSGDGLGWQEVLLRRGCLQRSKGQLLPTYAGLLLFGVSPQQWLPSATILAARFTGETLSDQFIKQELSGTLPEQLRQAEGFLRSNLQSVVRLEGLEHTDTLEYPFDAVRELLVNAVAHRDYNTQGDTIHLHLFSNRLEVHSPGGLPGPVTLQNLLQARFARNAIITQLLSDLGFVERLGYGLDRVVSVMESRGLPPPRFEEVAGAFRVTLYNDLDSLGLPQSLKNLHAIQRLGVNPRQQKALSYVARHQRITNRDFQELCPGVHMETLRRDLADLVSQGLFIKVGDKRATYYILKSVNGLEGGK